MELRSFNASAARIDIPNTSIPRGFDSLFQIPRERELFSLDGCVYIRRKRERERGRESRIIYEFFLSAVLVLALRIRGKKSIFVALKESVGKRN